VSRKWAAMNDHRFCLISAYLAASVALTEVSGQTPSSSPTVRESEVASQEALETKIRSRVTLVNTPVTVMNEKGQLVYDLEAKDFRLTDNGVRQEITNVDLGNNPLSLVILVETSSRIEPLLPEIRKTGIVFKDTVIGPRDEAAVLGFNDSIDTLLDFSNNSDDVLSTMDRLKAGTGRSRLFDAMAAGVEMLSRLQPQPTADLPERRRVIVIMSEETDVGSETRLNAVLRRAQLSNVAIFSVGISRTLAEWKAPSKEVRPQLTPEGIFPQPNLPGSVQTPETEATRYGYGNLINLMRNVKSQFNRTLEIAASRTGGQYIAAFKGNSMQSAVDEIGGELHSQYSLTYEPTGTKPTGYHVIQVHVDRANLKVHARPGYYVSPPEN
jgi:VWFA-related protein